MRFSIVRSETASKAAASCFETRTGLSEVVVCMRAACTKHAQHVQEAKKKYFEFRDYLRGDFRSA